MGSGFPWLFQGAGPARWRPIRRKTALRSLLCTPASSTRLHFPFPGFRFLLKYILHTASPDTSCSLTVPPSPPEPSTHPEAAGGTVQFGYTAVDSSTQPTHQCLPLERAKSRLGCSWAARHRVTKPWDQSSRLPSIPQIF